MVTALSACAHPPAVILDEDSVMDELLKEPTKRIAELLLPLLIIVAAAKDTTVPLAVPSMYKQLPVAPMALIVEAVAAKVSVDVLATSKKLCFDVAVSVELTNEIVTAEEVV